MGANGYRRFRKEFTWRTAYPCWRRTLTAAMESPAGEFAA